MTDEFRELIENPKASRPVPQLCKHLKAPISEAERSQREKNRATALADRQINYEKKIKAILKLPRGKRFAEDLDATEGFF